MNSLSSLSARERLLVGLALLVGLVMILYLYLWEPKMQQLRELRQLKVPQSEQTLAWVKQALEGAETQAGSGREQIIEGPLLTVIEQTAQRAGVRENIRRIQPNQAQSVRIWMEGVVFDKWLRWLDLLRQQNVFVERSSIASEGPGLVTIRMTLARP